MHFIAWEKSCSDSRAKSRKLHRQNTHFVSCENYQNDHNNFPCERLSAEAKRKTSKITKIPKRNTSSAFTLCKFVVRLVLSTSPNNYALRYFLRLKLQSTFSKYNQREQLSSNANELNENAFFAAKSFCRFGLALYFVRLFSVGVSERILQVNEKIDERIKRN